MHALSDENEPAMNLNTTSMNKPVHTPAFLYALRQCLYLCLHLRQGHIAHCVAQEVLSVLHFCFVSHGLIIPLRPKNTKHSHDTLFPCLI